MNIDLVFRIAGVGIIVAVLDILLKKSGKDEQAMMTTIAGLVVVLMMLIGEIGTLFETVREVFGL
ncbi:MAG: stage III sporulation protein AC [Ruminiclostridium sp.]|nr:stage III sporulation protein AC [Ruminiclostridium sp.]